MLNTQARLNGDLTAALDRFEAKVKAEVLRVGAGAMSYVIYGEVKSNASRHVKTGSLLDAVYQFHVDDRSNGDRQVYQVGVNRKKAPHWHLLEYGTSRSPAYPIVRPAFDHIGEAIKAGQQRMAEKMKELG